MQNIWQDNRSWDEEVNLRANGKKIRSAEQVNEDEIEGDLRMSITIKVI
jgi:hypothetical protein